MKKTRAIVLNEKDNVATMLNDVRRGDDVEVVFQGRSWVIKALSDIPFGHKIALKDIHEGEYVIKYGEIVGVARKEIRRGEHVHVHNLRSAF